METNIQFFGPHAYARSGGLPWAQEALDLARATCDASLLVTGHTVACICYCYAGEFTKATEHADKVVDLYGAARHRHLADILNTDPKTAAVAFASISTWILGYPNRALQLSHEKDAHARRRGHPFDLGFALIRGAHELDHRCGHEDLRKRAEECEQLGRENSLPFLWAMLAPISHGQALIGEATLVPCKAGQFWFGRHIAGRLEPKARIFANRACAAWGFFPVEQVPAVRFAFSNWNSFTSNARADTGTWDMCKLL